MPTITVIEPTKQIEKRQTETEKRKLRVAAYARVSTEQDEQQNSYEAQVEYYTRYITGNPDWEMVSVFADEGISGTSTKSRDGFNLMIGQAMSGGIDLILTKSISRFARNTVDTLQIVRELKAVGVEVIFEKENLRTMDPKCEVMLTIMSSLAQEESRSISENVRWGKQKSMQQGKVTMAYNNFLGYRRGEDGRPEVVEEEAKVVRRIYDLFLQDYTLGDIARILTSEHILTPGGKQKWYTNTIASILRNEKYKGDALLQKTYVADFLTKEVKHNNGERPQYYVENSHEAIIDAEVFDKVQEKMKKRSAQRHKVRGGHPFTGKLICADCGEFYGHKTWHNHANTEKYDVWYCNARYKGEKKCTTPTLREDDIKQIFVKALRTLGENVKYSESSWRRLIESVVVQKDRRAKVLLKDGREITVAL